MQITPTASWAMAENGSGKPEFETDETRSFFRCRLPVHPGVQDGVHDKGAESRAESRAESAISRLLLLLEDKPKSRLQKYQLTELGKQQLEALKS